MTLPMPSEAPEEAPSPFLPDSYIQYAWDSTSLELFKRCPRLYYYVMIEGWQPHGENIHLRFGIEYHQALHDYELARVDGAKHDQAVIETIRSLLTRIHDWDPEPRTASEGKKTKANLVRAVMWYLDLYADNDQAKTVILDNGLPAMEVSFRFNLDYGPFPEQPYILCGHLDRVVNFNEELFVMDRKTASSTIGKYYFNQFHPHNQMSLYTLAGQIVLHTPVRGVILDAVNVGETPQFQRGLTYRTQDQLDEWMYDLQFVFANAEDYATEGYWPMNDTACDKYGGCKFREICQKSPKARENFLRSGYTKEEIWNPLKSR